MICKHPGNPLLHKGIVGMRFLLFWGSSFPLQRIKSSMEVFKGASGKPPCRVRRREILATNCNPPQKIRLRSGFLRSLRRRLIQHIANEVIKERLNIFFIAVGAENARVVRIRSRIQERVQIRQIRTRDAV